MQVQTIWEALSCKFPMQRQSEKAYNKKLEWRRNILGEQWNKLTGMSSFTEQFQLSNGKGKKKNLKDFHPLFKCFW